MVLKEACLLGPLVPPGANWLFIWGPIRLQRAHASKGPRWLLIWGTSSLQGSLLGLVVFC